MVFEGRRSTPTKELVFLQALSRTGGGPAVRRQFGSFRPAEMLLVFSEAVSSSIIHGGLACSHVHTLASGGASQIFMVLPGPVLPVLLSSHWTLKQMSVGVGDLFSWWTSSLCGSSEHLRFSSVGLLMGLQEVGGSSRRPAEHCCCLLTDVCLSTPTHTH